LITHPAKFVQERHGGARKKVERLRPDLCRAANEFHRVCRRFRLLAHLLTHLLTHLQRTYRRFCSRLLGGGNLTVSSTSDAEADTRRCA
jgi:hypothetical protein